MPARRKTVSVPLPAAGTGWLLLDDVKRQLTIDATDTRDDQIILDCIAATEPEVVRARPDIAADPAASPDAYRGAVMLAARLVRRRNTPGGVESFGESITFVASYDPDIDHLLRRGRYRLPGVG